MSFVSKIRMFLNTDDFPTLDERIADAAKIYRFGPLRCLNIQSGATPKNERAYEKWAAWCRGIAYLVNANPRSPHHNDRDYRAVDVERAIFQLTGSNKSGAADGLREKNSEVVQKLLNGPQGWKFDVHALSFSPTMDNQNL